MRLSQALEKANAVSDLYDIFVAYEVEVKIHCLSDSVRVKGYEGTVSTDEIARKISELGFVNTQESLHLAESLATKIFLPLKELVEDPENRCALYQLVALTRIGWTPPPTREFGGSIALKHAMCLGFLDEKNYFTG